MRIAVLANLKKNAPTWEGMSVDQWDDLDSPKTIDAIVAALQARGHQATFFEAQILPPHNLIDRLQDYHPDICFNIAESHFGDGREAQIPAVLEMLRIPYTGSKVMTLALALDKPMTKRVLYYHGLPTPEFQVFDRPDEPIDADLLDDTEELRFPLFVKPSREGTSMGVSAESIVYTVEQLQSQVDKQLQRYQQPILAEHYIKGRELTIGMIGNIIQPAARRISDHTAPNEMPEGITFFPGLEVDTGAYEPSEAGLYTNRMKVELADDFRYLCPAPLEPELRAGAATAGGGDLPRHRLPGRLAGGLPPGRRERQQALHSGGQPAARPESRLQRPVPPGPRGGLDLRAARQHRAGRGRGPPEFGQSAGLGRSWIRLTSLPEIRRRGQG